MRLKSPLQHHVFCFPVTSTADCWRRPLTTAILTVFLNKPWLNEELVEIVKSAILLKKEEDDHKRMLANARKQIRLATTLQAATLPSPIDNAAIAADVFFRPLNELSGDVG